MSAELDFSDLQTTSNAVVIREGPMQVYRVAADTQVSYAGVVYPAGTQLPPSIPYTLQQFWAKSGWIVQVDEVTATTPTNFSIYSPG